MPHEGLPQRQPALPARFGGLLAVALLLAAPAASACGEGEPDTGRPPGERQLYMSLIAAAERGELRRVRQLLERGASARARDADGRTALTAAAFENQIDVARVLVAAGADVNAKDRTEQSPYLIATSEVGDDPRLLELTLTGGAELNDKDSYNGTGLSAPPSAATRASCAGCCGRASSATTSTGSAGPRCTKRSCSATAARATRRRCEPWSRAAST